MSRDDGFPIADISTAYLDDAKVRHLWRLLGDSDRMCAALMIHLATFLASWGEGHRVPVEEGAPLWLRVDDELVAALVTTRLLDRSHRVSAKSWSGWYGPAATRREARREAGRLGGQAKAKRTSSDARATLYPSGRQAGPSIPSEPSPAPARSRGRRGAAAGPTSLREAIAGTPFAAELGLEAES